MNEQAKKIWEEECAQVAAYYAKLYKERQDMSNRHPLADLLIYAAENKDARFSCCEYGDRKIINAIFENCGIETVLTNPQYNWQIEYKPKTITKLFKLESHPLAGLRYTEITELADVLWDLKVTYEDGVAVKVEFHK